MTKSAASPEGRSESGVSPKGEVPVVSSALPSWWDSLRLGVLLRVVGPWRRRFWKVDPNPPPPLTAEQIFNRLMELPVSQWTYDYEPGIRHLGPMSQDFAASFGLGRTNRMIEMVDANGVNVVAIKALARRVVRLEAEVARLRTALDEELTDADPDQPRADTDQPEARVDPADAPAPRRRQVHGL